MRRTFGVSNTITELIILLFKVILIVFPLLVFATGKHTAAVACALAFILYYRSMEKDSNKLLKYLGIFIFIISIIQTIRIVTLPIDFIEVFVGYLLGVVFFWILLFVVGILIHIVDKTDRAIGDLL